MKQSVPEAHSHLLQLGKATPLPQRPEEAKLESIPNRWPASDYTVQLICEEFTCLCPMTGQPDFAKIVIEYRPDKWLIESKSLKLYLGSYRNVGIFHEFVVNAICHDLVQLLGPRTIEVRGEFSTRGGIRIVPVARWTAPTVPV
jgi:7-cyano-7-deazaguanine reductase